MKFVSTETEARFRTFVPGAPEDVPPSVGIGAMLAFWRDERCEDAEPEEQDGDGLLFQWGTYDWTYCKPPKPKFYMSITRQLYFDLEESTGETEIWHLRLEYEYQDAPALAALGRGERWCFAQSNLDEFREFIFGSEALNAVADRRPLTVNVEFEQT